MENSVQAFSFYVYRIQPQNPFVCQICSMLMWDCVCVCVLVYIGECEFAELHCSTRLCRSACVCVDASCSSLSDNDVYLMHSRCKKLFAIWRCVLRIWSHISIQHCTWPACHTLMLHAELLIRVALIMPNMLPFHFPYAPVVCDVHAISKRRERPLHS